MAEKDGKITRGTVGCSKTMRGEEECGKGEQGDFGGVGYPGFSWGSGGGGCGPDQVVTRERRSSFRLAAHTNAVYGHVSFLC